MRVREHRPRGPGCLTREEEDYNAAGNWLAPQVHHAVSARAHAALLRLQSISRTRQQYVKHLADTRPVLCGSNGSRRFMAAITEARSGEK